MSRLGYVDKIQDPSSNGDWYEIVDSNARELVHKIEKTIVDSLPTKPNTRDKWLEMEPYLYYVPITGKENEFDVWTLFFTGDPSVASDYTDQNNYEWTKVVSTDVDMSNVSMVGHTHEVIPEISVDDHDYTPQGTVNSSFEGYNGNTDSKTHWHTVTPSGSVSSSFSGTPGNTNTGYADISFSKDGKKLSKLAVSLRPVTSVDLTSSTTTSVAKPTFASNSGSYDSTKSIFNGIQVSDGVLSFVTKKLDTADAYTGLQGSIAASSITIGGSGNTDCYMANGDVESGTDLLGYDSSVSDKGHTHSYTPSGSVSSSFSGSQVTTSQDTHSHQFTPNGDITSSFSGLRANLKHKVDSKKVRTSPDQEDPGGYVFDWYGIRYPENASSRFKERIGNMDMHRMLPIQTKMRRCILGDNGEVKYYLDDRDSTKRAGSQEGWVTSQEKFMSKVETDDIRDETEEIEGIKGNSVVLNQLVPIPESDISTSQYGVTITDNRNGSYSVSGNATQSWNVPIIGYSYSVIPNGHKIFIKNCYAAVLKNDVWYSDVNLDINNSMIFTTPSDGDIYKFSANIYVDTNISYSGLYYPQVFDLTQMGIDSFTTVDQVEAYLKENFGERSYYPYTTGELLSYGGKMVKWNQLVQNGDFSDGVTDWDAIGGTSLSVNDNILTVDCSAHSDNVIGVCQTNPVIVGHKYFGKFESKFSSSDFTATPTFYIGSSGLYGVVGCIGVEVQRTTDWKKYSFVGQLASDAQSSTGLRLYDATSQTVPTYMYLKNIQVIDLTAMFGAGSEPTLEECEKLFTEDYYPYNTGTNKNLYSIEGVDMGIKTVGFNKWDEEWEVGRFDTTTGADISDSQIRCKNLIPVVPNMDYFLCIPSETGFGVWALMYDNEQNVIPTPNWGGAYTDGNAGYIQNRVFKVSAQAAFIRFYVTGEYGTTYNHDICINISDPKRNGTYEPYNAHIYNHDITTMTGINPNTGEREVMFETGMKSAGSVYDRLYNDVNGNAVCKKMCGDVDMGTLNWYKNNDNVFYDNSSSVLQLLKSSTGDVVANMLCGKFVTNAFIPVLSQQNGIAFMDATNGLIVYDGKYSGYTRENFKAAMQGVYLNYELETPITYTDLQWADGSPVILPFEIEVEHNGTIENTPNITSGAPVMCAPDLTVKKYVLTQGANLDGSDGQVMVEIPEHWRKVYRVNESGTDYVYAKISPYPQEGWHHVEKNYIGAFEASIVDGKLSSSSDIKDLVYSHDANGKIVVGCNLTTSRMPKTYYDEGEGKYLTVDNYRYYARKRNNNLSAEWNGQTIQQWNDIAWLFFIEYATTNSQEQFKSERDANGFMQGGLGMGFSEFYDWGSYNNYYPVVPCGVTQCLGNHSGEILITVAGANYKVNSYRGVEMPFGHLWKLVDGIKYYDNTIYRAVNPSDFSNAESTTGYVEVGSKGTSDGYVTTVKIQKDSGYDERFDGDLTPTGVGGDTASYYCDYYWKNSGWRACLLGGSADVGSVDGFVYVVSDVVLSFAYQVCGSRLCFLPSSEQ